MILLKNKKISYEVLMLLKSSWKDINFDYNLLTATEKECMSKETFDLIVSEINKVN